MEILHPCCCGLDVHKATVVACLLRTGADGRRTKETRSFATTAGALAELRAWLVAAGCGPVAMESTGVYWKPVYNTLTETDGMDVRVVNPQHVKAIPGRKTDVSDAARLAELLQHGLLRASYIPDRAQRELRDLTRTRTSLTDTRTQSVNRLHKVLEDAGIKLASVTSNVVGVSGRAILAALLDGVTDTTALAELARGRLRRKRAALADALTPRLGPHHRALVAMHLSHIDFLDEQIAELDQRIAAATAPFVDELARLDSIPGVGQRVAEILVAEIGVVMAQFPTARHLASWAGMCPGNHRSAGKRKDGRTRKGSPHLRRVLAEAANAASRSKTPGQTAFAQLYRRLVVRHGPAKANLAVGHAILTTAYYLLTRNTLYRELDPRERDPAHDDRTRRRALAQLAALGYHVTLAPARAA